MQFEDQDQQKKEKPQLELTDLDVRGREIAGLRPRLERFSRLEVGKDVTDILRARDIQCSSDLDEAFVFVNPSGGTEQLMVEAPHWRSITKEGIHAERKTPAGSDFYYVANTKGAGYLKPTLKGGHSLEEYDSWKRVNEYKEKGAYGIAGENDFSRDEESILKKSRLLADGGLRTEMYYAVGSLANVYYKGERQRIVDLRKNGVFPLPRYLKPQIGIRLLKTNTRIAEVVESEDQRSRDLFQKAFETFNRERADKKLPLPEIRLGDAAGERTYFMEFFRRMGENLAALQNVGFIGWHMHSANVTLAAEIADIGSYEHFSFYGDDLEHNQAYSGVRRGTLKDMRDFAGDLELLLSAADRLGLSAGNRAELVKAYRDAFQEALDEKKLEAAQVKKSDLIAANRKIADAVLLKGRRLAGLKRGTEIEDWGLGL